MAKKQEAYYFQAKSGIDVLKAALADAHSEAYQKGYSVVEIARTSGSKTCRYIHAALVKSAMIPRAKTGCLPKGLVPNGMAPYLSTRGLTFAKWVAGRGLKPETVLQDVIAGHGPGLEAIRIDFPGLYKKLTGADACLPPVPDLPPLEAIGKKIIITWDDGHDCYRCTVEGHDFAGYGNKPADALSLGLWLYRGYETIQRLSHLPDIRLERVGW